MDPSVTPGSAPLVVSKRAVREAVLRLRELSTDRLVSEEDHRRAYVRLAFITQAYIWCGRGGDDADDDDVQEHVPRQLAVPLLQVSAKVHLPPILTYAATCLWNFRWVGRGHGHDGDDDVDEARGGRVIPVLMDALQVAEDDDDDDMCGRHGQLSAALGLLLDCIEDVTELLERMYERCDATTFYHKIRPFLAGSAGMARLPKSTLLQLFDKFLGIRHGTSSQGGGGGDGASFHDEMKLYMPLAHRQLLVEMESRSRVRELAMSLPAGHDLRVCHQAVIDALSRLRSKHLNLVARYIVLPSSCCSLSSSVSSLSSSSSPSNGSAQSGPVGTAGTSPMSFLRETRRSTMMAGARLGSLRGDSASTELGFVQTK
ncbi:hypothetical protein E4U41_000304 [Claviceps citrina]|nr:hypothetical protein E4U41_000304 [Claviceps citrina]